MKIDRKELLKGLENILPALNRNSFIEHSNEFIFTGKQIVGYSDQICISFPFKTDFSFSLPSEEFYKIISNIDIDTLDINIKDNKLEIRGKGLKANINCNVDESILDVIDALCISKAKKEAKELNKNFIDGLKFCIFSASRDLQQEGLRCISIDNKFITSTDGYRISQYKIKNSFDFSFLIPASSIEELIKYNVNKYSIAKDKNWIYFFNDDGISFCSRLINTDFPSCIKLFNGFNEDIEIKIPNDIGKIITGAEILANGEKRIDKEIQVGIFKDRWECKGQNDFGDIVRDIHFVSKNVKEKGIKFNINPYFLKDIISKVETMFYSDDGKKILFKNNDFKHVIALLIEE
jgi:DNA polymerase III sliding clamp (beta) subunit (PCNA family)